MLNKNFNIADVTIKFIIKEKSKIELSMMFL